ncbi:MAG: sulfite exporter TauE/SafE family protein [Ignavibacteria bacterium]|nr:sulfite exporter TauE/SafE family protein [Ignavibacteria bacterium]
MELLSGFIIGLAGSFHCIGMCGPIVLSLPPGKLSSRSFISGRILYNAGRIITYALLGTLFGFLGNRIFLFGLQQSLSVITGIAILFSVIFTYKFNGLFSGNIFLKNFFIKFKTIFGRFHKRNSGFSMLITGVLNGFLPCGFVYIGLSGALLTGDTLSGTIYMVLFGIGTVPLMLGFSLAGNLFKTGMKDRIRKMIPAFTVLLALLFIARGLNLGIPFISPKISDTGTKTEELICH